MNKKTPKINKELQHDLALELTQRTINFTFADTEEETRRLIDAAISDYLKNARDAFERGAIVEAKTMLDQITYEQMKELKSIWFERANMNKTIYYEDTSIRDKVYLSNEGDEFYIEENGETSHFLLRLRFMTQNAHYVLLGKFDDETGHISKSFFYEYEFADEGDDSIHLVTDKKLIKELKEEVRIMFENMGINEDIGVDD